MKHSYSTTIENVEIIFDYRPGRPATYDDPEESAELEIEAVWLLDINGKRALDINPHITGSAMFSALFGRYIEESLFTAAEYDIADERAAATEYRRESRE